MKQLKHISLISAILLALLIRCDKNDESDKTVRLVCEESDWRIEGEDGKSNFYSDSWKIWDNRGWVDILEGTLTFENSGNSYEVYIESFLAFVEGKGVVRYSIVTATGGLFGSDTVDCSYY